MSHAEVCQIAEVLADAALQSASVRITGRLEAFDAQRGEARVAFQGASLTVETRRLAGGALQLRVGGLFQFLGETYRRSVNGRTEVRLVARVARNVDGMDVDLFLEALALRRQFLASR